MHLVALVSWMALVSCLVVSRLFNSLSRSTIHILDILTSVQAVMFIALILSGASLPHPLTCAVFTLNIITLAVLVPRVWRRTANSYLWGAVKSILPTSKDTNHKNKIKHPLVRRVFSPLVRRLWIGEVYGLENIPEQGACLVALNHESYFDFICFTAVIDRKIHYLAAEKFFEHQVWKRVMSAMECIRVDRFCRVNRTALKHLNDVIARGRLVGIFPEGTRSVDGRLMRGKPGVAYLAQRTGIPVIPVGLIGTYEIMSRHNRIPRLRKAVIRIGKPIRFESPESGKATPEQMQGITDQIMLKIAELTGESYPCAEAAHE
jgi:1-acyl-sn-glycerol-3-phosphate acyltransferase